MSYGNYRYGSGWRLNLKPAKYDYPRYYHTLKGYVEVLSPTDIILANEAPLFETCIYQGKIKTGTGPYYATWHDAVGREQKYTTHVHYNIGGTKELYKYKYYKSTKLDDPKKDYRSESPLPPQYHISCLLYYCCQRMPLGSIARWAQSNKISFGSAKNLKNIYLNATIYDLIKWQGSVGNLTLNTVDDWFKHYHLLHPMIAPLVAEDDAALWADASNNVVTWYANEYVLDDRELQRFYYLPYFSTWYCNNDKWSRYPARNRQAQLRIIQKGGCYANNQIRTSTVVASDDLDEKTQEE